MDEKWLILDENIEKLRDFGRFLNKKVLFLLKLDDFELFELG